MDTARQVVRWSIPGSVLVLVALAMTVVALTYERLLAPSRQAFLQLSPAGVALFTLATIPIGYLIYQVYYSREGRVRRFPRSIMPVDRGHLILSHLSLVDRTTALGKMGHFHFDSRLFGLRPEPSGRVLQVPVDSTVGIWPVHWLPLLRFPQLAIEESRPRGRQIASLLRPSNAYYTERRQHRLRYYHRSQSHLERVRTLLAVLSTDDRGKALAAEYTSLSDIYHGLGATRTSLAMGLPVGAVICLFRPDGSLLQAVIAVVVIAPLAGWAYFCVHVNRAEVLRRLVSTVHLGVTYILADLSAEDGASPGDVAPSAGAGAVAIP